jgi:cytochrome c
MARSFSLLALGATLLFAPMAWAAGQATPDEAKAMAIKAAEYLKSAGPDKAFPDFIAKDGPWHDRDLYVFVQNDKGFMMVHGNNPSLAGRDVSNLKDPDGKIINNEVLAIKDAGWINLKWQNPLNKQIELKTEYVIRVGVYFVGVGAYAQ